MSLIHANGRGKRFRYRALGTVRFIDSVVLRQQDASPPSSPLQGTPKVWYGPPYVYRGPWILGGDRYYYWNFRRSWVSTQIFKSNSKHLYKLDHSHTLKDSRRIIMIIIGHAKTVRYLLYNNLLLGIFVKYSFILFINFQLIVISNRYLYL